MTYAIEHEGALVQISGAFTSADGTSHPAEWLASSTAEDRAAFGVFEVIQTPPPAGVKSATPKLVKVDGAVHQQWDVEEYTPAETAELMLVHAEVYYQQRATEPLPVYGVFPDQPIVVKMTPDGREKISGAFGYSDFLIRQGLSPSLTFDDEAGAEVTLDGSQAIALALNVAVFTGSCDGALRQVRKTITDALAAGGDTPTILSIDITAGYP